MWVHKYIQGFYFLIIQPNYQIFELLWHLHQLGSLYDAVDDVIALSKSSGASVVSYRRDMVLNDTLYNSITTQLSGGNFLQEKLLKLLTRSGFYYLFL